MENHNFEVKQQFLCAIYTVAICCHVSLPLRVTPNRDARGPIALHRFAFQSPQRSPAGAVFSCWKVRSLVSIPSGKHTKNYGKSSLLMGKSTINGHFQ